jgi:PITH domain
MFGVGGNGAVKPAAAGAGAAAPSTAIVDITDKVDKKGCFLLNGAGSTDCASVLGGVVVHSDAGPQLIFHLPLNETCKITSIQITPANAEETPVLVKLFVNKRCNPQPFPRSLP